MQKQSPVADLPKPKRNTRIKWAIRVGGTLLLLFFLFRLDLNLTKLGEELSKANLGWIGLAIILVFPLIGLKAWRWQIILHHLGIRLSFGEAYRLYAIGLSAGSFTPGQAGDAIKAFYMRERGYPLGSALVSIVLDRLFDLAILILLAISGLSFLGTAFEAELPVLLILLGGTLAGVIILSLPKLRNWLLKTALNLFLRRNTTDQTSPSEQATAQAQLHLADLLPGLGVTLLATVLTLFRIWLLALALNMSLNPLQVVAVSSLATAISLVPISVGGIGARDVVLVSILDKLGYAKEKAVSLSTLILLLNLVNLVVGYLIWITPTKHSTTFTKPPQQP